VKPANYVTESAGISPLADHNHPDQIVNGALCADIGVFCLDWARKDECMTNPGYMNANCMKSCGRCIEISPHTGLPVLDPAAQGKLAVWNEVHALEAVPQDLDHITRSYVAGADTALDLKMEHAVTDTALIDNSLQENQDEVEKAIDAAENAAKQKIAKMGVKAALVEAHEHTAALAPAPPPPPPRQLAAADGLLQGASEEAKKISQQASSGLSPGFFTAIAKLKSWLGLRKV